MRNAMNIDKDSYCLYTSDKEKVCLKNDDKIGDTFKASNNYFVNRAEGTGKTSPFRMVKTCKVQGKECFRKNLLNASFFLLLFLVANFIINFLHELVHYSFLVVMEVPDASFTFSANFGFTTGTFPDFADPSIPWYLWFLEMMGPLLIVNFPAVLITMGNVKHVGNNPPYSRKTIKQEGRWVHVNFLKAIAYASVFTILLNTIFSPFYKILYTVLGQPRPSSDLEWAWIVASELSNPYKVLMQLSIVFSTGIMIAVTILFLFLYNRRETPD
jgi:hypothetical protein